MKFIKGHKIEKKKIKFELGETVMTINNKYNRLIYQKIQYKTSLSWTCDGKDLEHGCYSVYYHFPITQPRFRCSQCDFDLCDKCIVHYLP